MRFNFWSQLWYLCKSELRLMLCWDSLWNSTGGILYYWNLSRGNHWDIICDCSTVVWELTILGLPPGFEAVGSEGCRHILNGVAVGVSELIVHPPRIAFKTVFCILTMDRDRDADVSGACETYRVFWGLEKKKTFMRTAGIQMFWTCTCFSHPLIHMTH